MTDVSRLYKSRRQIFTVQMVRICICSTTKTHFEPTIRSLMFSGVSSVSSFGSMRLLLVREMTLMPIMKTVSVIWGRLDIVASGCLGQAGGVEYC